MSKKKNTPSVLIITAEQRFDVEKPRYNAHQTGHGAHKNKKAYTRKTKHKGRGVE
jgi:hypothetical protein